MNTDIITTEEYAKNSHTDIHFINQLGEYGLIEIIIREARPCIPASELPILEKYIRLRYDLDINLEGIEAISHLLHRITDMQTEMDNLRRQVRLYHSL